MNRPDFGAYGRGGGVATAVTPLPMPDRQPPYAPEAEISVLGGMLIDPDAVSKAIEIVDESMFYREANRRVFHAMARLFQRGAGIDPVTVGEELTKTGELDAVGGMPYLSELLDTVPTAANVEYHAKIVRERAVLRRLIEAASQVIRDSYEVGERTVEQVLDEAEHRIFQVAQSHDRKGFVWIKQLLKPLFEEIEIRAQTPGALTGIPSGYRDLDEMTGGLQKGDLIILAARPSMGKTSLMLGMALNAAIDHQVPTAVFSLEMSNHQLVQRMLAYEGLLDLRSLTRGFLRDDDYMKLSTAAGRLNLAQLYMDDSASLSVLEIRAKSRRLKADRPNLGLVLVDYIQLMQAGNAENRQQEVSAISRGLKALAKELEVPIVALSQLSRAPEQRTDHRPQLSDLRESGSIEQDADLVMFLYRPEYYAKDEAERAELAGQAELIIAKQRNGPTGMVPLYFRAQSTRFEMRTREDLP